MNEQAHSQDDGHDPDGGPLSAWMYVGIVVVSLASFYVTLLLTKLYY